MALIVQKFGGTSVASIDCIEFVADRIKATKEDGHEVIVVLSAMSGETDRLLSLSQSITNEPPLRELDVLLSSGEQVSVALLSMALAKRGVKAKSLLGQQIPIQTDDAHSKARITGINDAMLLDLVKQDIVPVVAGFQGINVAGDITTLGRGGSDTTAVGLAASVKADECQIFTDVKGVYTTDPKMVSNARRLDRITFEEMFEMSSMGSKVLQQRAVEFAGKYKVPLRVLSTFEQGEGTLVTFEDKNNSNQVVSGIAFNREEAKLVLRGIPNSPGIAGKVLGPICSANIDVDMISQQITDSTTDVSFTVHRRDFAGAKAILEEVCRKLDANAVTGSQSVAKISLVGTGIRSQSAIATKMFETLGALGINIQLISSSEIKVSVVLDERSLEQAVSALHRTFGLHEAVVI